MTGNLTQCTAFQGVNRLASGAPADVALAVKAAMQQPTHCAVLVFDDATGRRVEFDLRGTEADIMARLTPEETGRPIRGPGRPRLGVVAREVTLLPRHWDWLNEQPGGASVALRRLLDSAGGMNASGERAQQAREAADCFMAAMAGNQPGYAAASRALYAGGRSRFHGETENWPGDVRDHARRLAEAGLDSAAG